MYRNAVIDRLRSIPSEMQVVKMLHDRGCIINEAAMVHDIGKEFQKNHIDIVAYLPDRKPGVLHEFKIDVKSHEAQHTNILLETGTRPDRNGKRHKSWAFCAYPGDDITKKNRYLADVLDDCNGYSFHKIISDQNLIDNQLSEEENEECIVNYFSAHMELLDHDIIMYSFVDITDFLLKTGGDNLEKRDKDWIAKVSNAQCITSNWEKWDQSYGRYIYSFDKSTATWITSSKGKKIPGVEGLPYWKSIDIDGRELSEFDNECGMQDFISMWKHDQKDGLTARLFKRMLGLSREE